MNSSMPKSRCGRVTVCDRFIFAFTPSDSSFLLLVTTLEIDAIVNAANEECKGGGGSPFVVHIERDIV